MKRPGWVYDWKLCNDCMRIHIEKSPCLHKKSEAEATYFTCYWQYIGTGPWDAVAFPYLMIGVSDEFIQEAERQMHRRHRAEAKHWQTLMED